MAKNDQALIRAVLAGNKDAYGDLAERHGDTMFRVAFRITESEPDAQEVVQEALLRSYRSLTEFDARSDFRTWIYRITVNCALQLLEKRKKEAAVPITEEFDEQVSGIQLPDATAGPERLLLDREIEHRRHAAMEKMTEDERVAFVLRHLEGRSTEEIATALGVTPNNAKQSVFRAVQKMRKALAPLWGAPLLGRRPGVKS
jgi:RNA polymerase sigma-70 factor (ECF subfamily)